MNTQTKAGDIHLHIDTLVLRGFTGLDTEALTAALHDALSAELRTLAAVPRDIDLSRAQASVDLPQGAGGAHLSGALAQALSGIVQGLGARSSPPGNTRHD